MSAPITSPSSFAKTAAITCTSSVTITAYRCTRRARFIREHPTCPSTSSRAFAKRPLVGSPNAKSPQPTRLSSQRGPTEDEDGRRDLTLLRLQDPVLVEIVLRIIPGVV